MDIGDLEFMALQGHVGVTRRYRGDYWRVGDSLSEKKDDKRDKKRCGIINMMSERSCHKNM